MLVDTGVWYSIFDPRDTTVSQEDVQSLESRISHFRIALPWPVAYETLRTRFVKNRLCIERFEQKLKSPLIEMVDDSSYRERALELSIDSSLRGRRPLSMVDCIIRLMIDDPKIKIQSLATYNIRDFADVCHRRHIEIISK